MNIIIQKRSKREKRGNIKALLPKIPNHAIHNRTDSHTERETKWTKNKFYFPIYTSPVWCQNAINFRVRGKWNSSSSRKKNFYRNIKMSRKKTTQFHEINCSGSILHVFFSTFVCMWSSFSVIFGAFFQPNYSAELWQTKSTRFFMLSIFVKKTFFVVDRCRGWVVRGMWEVDNSMCFKFSESDRIRRFPLCFTPIKWNRLQVHICNVAIFSELAETMAEPSCECVRVRFFSIAIGSREKCEII